MAEPQTRILKLAYPVALKENSKLHVLLESHDKKPKFKEAFLNPKKIVKVYKARVVRYNLRDKIPFEYDVVFIEYDSNHSYYNELDWGEIPKKWVNRRGVLDYVSEVKELRELKLEEAVAIDPWWIRKYKWGYRVYLEELGRWDNYVLNFTQALVAYYENVHPFYGVMD